MSRLGLNDFLMPVGKMSRKLWLSTSHLGMLTQRSSGGPNSSSTAKTDFTPLSEYQAWRLRPAQSSLVDNADTRMLWTKEKNKG